MPMRSILVMEVFLMKFIKNKYQKANILPGFPLSFIYSLSFFSIIVLAPISLIFIKTLKLDIFTIIDIIFAQRVIEAFKVSFLASFLAAFINLIFGFLTAWSIERYNFPFKKILDSIIDLPFAFPTAVAGITLSSLYSPNGWMGKLLEPAGIQISYNFIGIVFTLIFVSFPFCVRTLQPVINGLDKDIEKAAECLGANSYQIFFKIILPELLPGIITGFILSFARSLGEYGSVIFISSNLPYKTEIVPLLIKIKIEQFDLQGAVVISAIMLLIAFFILLIINIFQFYLSKKLNLE